MKTLLALLVFAFGTSAWACPNLAGDYSCSNGDEAPPSLLSVTQRIENGVTIYTLDEENFGQSDYTADGIWREKTDKDEVGGERFVKKRITCVGSEKLVIDYHSTYKSAEYDLSADINIEHSVNELGDFVSHSKGTTTQNGQTEEYELIEVCEDLS